RQPIAAQLYEPLRDFEVWCPRCTDPVWAEQLAALPAYLAILSQFYQSDAYLARGSGAFKLKVDARARELLANNGYLQRLFSHENQ
ncbi:MAG TPA: hypothetical protein VHO25_19715, partial [Polyangiaceae bacterium]|nr:hypothetical protein [Polyangiaceae bacterium]